MHDEHLHRERGGFRRERVERENALAEQQHEAGHHPSGEVGEQHQLLRVFLHAVVVLCADALADDGDHRHADSRAGDRLDRGEVSGDGIRRDGHRAEAGHDAGHEELADLENAVFEAVRHADLQNALDHRPVQLDLVQPVVADGAVRIAQQERNDYGARDAREERGGRRAGHAHIEHIDQKRVAAHIDGVHHKRDQHRGFGIAHRAEQRRAGVIDAEEGVGDCGKQEIDLRVRHDIRLDGAEDQPQRRLPHGDGENGDHNRKCEDGIEKLLCRGAGIFPVAAPDILRGDDCTAGRERGKDGDQQKVDRIDQRNARNGGLAAGGDHHGIGDANRDGEHLLDDQGNNQIAQTLVGKHVFAPFQYI